MTEPIRTDPKFRDRYLQEIVLGRLRETGGRPEILFLASSEADYVTGAGAERLRRSYIHV